MKEILECPSAIKEETASKWFLPVLAFLFIVAAIERIYGIDRQSLWSDELYAVTASYKTFVDAWRENMLVDGHPPGYLSFMYFTLPITGYSDFGVRIHALLFGMAWIPLVFVFCRRWFGVSAALMATAVVASAYNAVYYSQEARSYSMLIVFNLWNLICLFEVLFSDKPQRKHKIGFLVSTTILLYLHYSGFVFLCAEALLVGILWVFYKRYSLKELGLLFGIPVLLYSPWLGTMYNNMVHTPSSWVMSASAEGKEAYFALQRLLAPDDGHMSFHLSALFLTIAASVWTYMRRGMSRQLLAVCSLFLLMVVFVLAFYVESLIATPLFEKRYFLMAMVLEAILVGWLGSQLLALLGRYWEKPLIVLSVVIYSVWTINANVKSGLYKNLDKDPVRDAVDIVKADLNKMPQDTAYSVVMTHPWFEHYLRQKNIAYEQKKRNRYYFVSQQFPELMKYFDAHKEKKVLYYILLREPNAQAALIPLMLNYQLLSKASATIEAGSIDVYKFDLQAEPDEAQLKVAGSNPSNDIARWVARDIGQKDPSTYRVLYTHDWVLPYLKRNGVVVPEGQEGSYVVNAQVGSVYRYMDEHPTIDTLYYLALQEPNAEGAELMLQLHYRLAAEKTVKTSVGDVSILKFLVKESPIVDEAAQARMRATPAYQVVTQMQEMLGQAPHDSAAIATANTWLEQYLKLGGLPIDESWADRRYQTASSAASLQQSLRQRVAVTSLYYVALRSAATEEAARALGKIYAQAEHRSIDAVAGSIDIYRFNIKP